MCFEGMNIGWTHKNQFFLLDDRSLVVDFVVDAPFAYNYYFIIIVVVFGDIVLIAPMEIHSAFRMFKILFKENRRHDAIIDDLNSLVKTVSEKKIIEKKSKFFQR